MKRNPRQTALSKQRPRVDEVNAASNRYSDMTLRSGAIAPSRRVSGQLRLQKWKLITRRRRCKPTISQTKPCQNSQPRASCMLGRWRSWCTSLRCERFKFSFRVSVCCSNAESSTKANNCGANTGSALTTQTKAYIRENAEKKALDFRKTSTHFQQNCVGSEHVRKRRVATRPAATAPYAVRLIPISIA